MATKVGIISEGPIDMALLPPLLERIATDRAMFTWPVTGDDVASLFALRKRGSGGVLEALRRLVNFLESNPPANHDFFVILLDRRTRVVQDEVKNLIRGRDRFVVGIAIEEIEAWWLGDRRSTLGWLRLDDVARHGMRYWGANYRAEDDEASKRTLDELTEISGAVAARYGSGNTQLAQEFAESGVGLQV